MKIAILFFSTSRYEYLFPMLESFHKNVDFSDLQTYKIFIDDYPDKRDDNFQEYIQKTYKIDKMIHNEKNEGYSVSWGKAWKEIPDDVDYIWHQEDDLQILEPISVKNIIYILQNSPKKLFQVVLKRDICYSGNNDYIYKIEKGDGEEVQIGDQHVVYFNSCWFISHPGLYPSWVTKIPYDYNPQEGVIPYKIKQKYPQSTAALYGKRKDPNRIKHIGTFNRGKKCIPGEPGWDRQQYLDENKDYYSLTFGKLWKGSRNYNMAQLHLTYTKTEHAIPYFEKSMIQDEDKDRKYLSAIYLADRKNDISYLIKATQIYPERLEAWFRLMKKNTSHISAAYGLTGFDFLKKNENKEYFKMEKHIYNYSFAFELCMVLYYAGYHDKIQPVYNSILQDKTPPHIWKQHLSNSRFYKLQSIPDNISLNTPSVIIIDNFLKEPDKERAFALSQEFKVSGNFPGKRTKSFATDKDKNMFEKILNTTITYWPVGENNYNGSYQYCTKNMRSWIHRDLTNFSAMIYLTPNPPPDSGTNVYLHKKTGKTLEKHNNGEFDKDSYNENAWYKNDVIGNRYNRLVIFQGTQSHKSAVYFGDNKDNGRLFKIFFFNTQNNLNTTCA